MRGEGRTTYQLQNLKDGEIFVVHTPAMREHVQYLWAIHCPGRNPPQVIYPSELERLGHKHVRVICDHECPLTEREYHLVNKINDWLEPDEHP